ncbi:MAG: tetratricopeptide repeat protein [Prevotella sp.]|nr:tetratricopeptide repeat protein [Prevotella sp.]
MEFSTHQSENASWLNQLKQVRALKLQLKKGYPIGDIISKIGGQTISSFPHSAETFDAIATDYELMMNYMLTGMADPSRAELYAQLVLRTYKLLGNIEMGLRLQYDADALSLFGGGVKLLDVRDIREKLEAYVSEMALLSLDSQEQQDVTSRDIASRHQQFLSETFINIVGSAQWSHELASDMLALILSPTIDSIDAQLLISAIMMGALFVADVEKVLTLMCIYEQAQSEKLRQRALVGWAFCLDKDALTSLQPIDNKLTDLLLRQQVRDDLLELQMQIVYCQNAERDEERIRKEVMPTLMSNQSYEITKFGIKEKDDDTLEDILNPDNEERKMEELESGIQKIIDMQRQGADIYFGGFSKMKRFGFFYTFANWFMPFYAEHPQLQHLSSDFLGSTYMQKMFEQGPFCDSDKYSFVLGLSSVFDQLPENIREMLKNGEATLGIVGTDTNQKMTPAYYRRLYLQDLYRFFKINNYQRAFYNPFEEREEHMLLANEIYRSSLHDQALRMVRFLYQRQMYKEAKALLMSYYDGSNVGDISLRALLAMKQGEYVIAEGLYQKAYEKEPSNAHLLKGYAMSAFYSGDFDDAAQLFEQLLESQPDSRKYKLNLAISYINNGKVDEGVKLLFELNYKFPADVNIKRALAWGFLYTGQLEKAVKLYAEIIADESASAVDYLNAGYSLWFDKRVEEAAERFADYLLKLKRDSADAAKENNLSSNALLEKFQEDLLLLAKYGISEVEMRLMADISTRNSHNKN